MGDDVCSSGIVGVLEANFIQPTHNKQDFEKTPLFQKLEDRLRQMASEYWWATSCIVSWSLYLILIWFFLKEFMKLIR